MLKRNFFHDRCSSPPTSNRAIDVVGVVRPSDVTWRAGKTGFWFRQLSKTACRLGDPGTATNNTLEVSLYYFMPEGGCMISMN
jgi:hypothetical protein